MKVMTDDAKVLYRQLLDMCNGDIGLFDRALDYARNKKPTSEYTRKDWLHGPTLKLEDIVDYIKQERLGDFK